MKTILKNKRYLLIALLLTAITFNSCGSDDPEMEMEMEMEPDPGTAETNTLTADAGSDQTIIENNLVTLDGSGSSDSEGGTFSYSWSIASQPNSSIAELNNDDTVTPSFTPDVSGVYEIELEISNDDFISTDIVSITVSAETSDETMTIGGNIREDIVLRNIIDTPGVPDYCITSSIDLDAVMTIEPGVELHFDADLSFQVGNNGVLIAEGTAEDHIVFTAKNQNVPWRGIGFISSDDFRNSMDYVDISYAGSDTVSILSRKAGLGISSFSTLSFTNSSVTNSIELGMFIEDDVDLTEFSNNRFENNAQSPLVLPADLVGQLDTASQFGLTNGTNMIEVIFGSINGAPAFWKPMDDGTNFYIRTSLDINSELNIMPGVNLFFDVDKSITVRGNGILIAKGTAEDHIVFTAKDTTAPWRGIGIISSDDFRNAMDYVDISYAGADTISILNRKSALGISSFSTFSFTNSSITNSLSVGMFIQDDVDLDFANNNFENNLGTPLALSSEQVHRLDTETTFGTTNGNNYIEVFGGTINYSDVVSWSAFTDSTPYFLTGNLVVSSGLIITPNVKVLIDSDVQIQVSSNGFISAKGESEAGRIVFTAFDQTLPWRGIVYSLSDSIRNELDYVEISYAGSSELSNISQNTNIGLFGSSNLTITNSLITNGVGYGFSIHNQAEINVDFETSNTITDNSLGSVFFD